MANTDNDVIGQRGENAHMMNFTKKLSMMEAAVENLLGRKGWCRSQSRIPTATKVMTPETRWRMDAIAVIGNRIVCRSRLTGLCFSHFLP